MSVSPDGPTPHLTLLTLGGVGGRLEVTSPTSETPASAAALGSSALGTTLLATGKPLALVVYLACAPARTAARDHLATLLWSSDDLSDARHALRQVLLRLRQQLGAEAIGATRDTVTLTVPCTLDRDTFVQASERGDLAAAVACYSGPFLPDLSFPGGREFDEWAALERAALSRRFQVAGQQEVRRLLDAGRRRDAVELARRVRDDQPFLETAWHPLVEALLVCDDALATAVEVAALARMLAEEEQEPSPVTRALTARARHTTPRRAPDMHTLSGDLVGREREFTAMLAAWEEVRRLRQGRHLHVRGDAGLGKTRLLRDVDRRLAAAGARTVALSSTPGDAAVPWSVLARLAQALATLPGARGIAPACARHLVALNPALSAVYDVTPGDELAGGATVRVRALAVADLLGAVADERAVAVLLDDVHWWDAASRDALSLVASAAGARAVLLVTASRGTMAPLLSATVLPELALTPLDCSRLETLLASIALAPSAAWAHQVAGALHEGSGGNPLLALAALDDACRGGALLRDDGRWETHDIASLLGRLRSGDALRRRVEALAPALRRALLVLAVAARPLGGDTLHATLHALDTNPSMADAPAPRRDHADPSVLDNLAATGLVLREGDRWRIAHDLLAASLLDWTPVDAVRLAHAALGRTIAEGARGDAVALALRHLVEGEDTTRARALFRRWCVDRRAAGDRRPMDDLFADVGMGSANDTAEVLRATLRAALPWHVQRPRLRSATFATSAVAMLLAIGFALAVWRRPLAPPLSLAVAVGAGDSLRIVQLAIDTTERARGRPVRVADGTPVATVHPRQSIAAFLKRGPGEAGILLHRFSGDSGGFDIYRLDVDGRLVRLTWSRGDDIDPAWSPDGRQVVFQTSRWTRDAAMQTQLAIMARDGSQVRPLTTGAVRDSRPRWSPDGTRIAFLRQLAADGAADGAAEQANVCWTPVRGGTVMCHPTRVDGAGTLFAWADADHVWAGDAREAGRVTLHAVDSGAERSVAGGMRWVVDVAPSGWSIGRDAMDAPWHVAPPGGAWRRTLLSGSDSVELVSWWPEAGRQAALTSLVASGDTGVVWPVGVALSVPVEARYSDGTHRPVADGVVRWSSRSPAVAVRGARIVARDTGSLLLFADVGGWVRDSLLWRFARLPVITVLDESWRDARLPAWAAFGEPSVRVVPVDGAPSLLVAGDGTFVSGVLSRARWPAAGGVGVEFVVRTPVLRDTWQRLHLALVAEPRVSIGGVQTASACGWRYPAREEHDAFRRASVVPGTDTTLLIGPPGAVGDRQWHRVQLQWLPDGSCAAAVDGRVVARGRAQAAPQAPVAVAIEGQSVATMILVRSVRVWQGTRTDVAW